MRTSTLLTSLIRSLSRSRPTEVQRSVRRYVWQTISTTSLIQSVFSASTASPTSPLIESPASSTSCGPTCATALRRSLARSRRREPQGRGVLPGASTRSAGAARTWSALVVLNSNSGTNFHFFPAVSVNPGSGNVYVSFYSTENNVGKNKYDYVFRKLSATLGGTMTDEPLN